ncbi:MAG: NUDIX hydrolase [Elusimicrobia bacterium]|nr:NUDIX hydrolase [Elusimicrobiota bacterium]
MKNLVEKKFKSRRVFEGDAVSFYSDTVTLPNGNKSVRDYMLHPGAVTIAAFLDKKNLLMLRQYRYPVKKTIYELPAGKIDPKENPLTCARRELLEETGYWPKKIRKINSFWPTPAFATEMMHVYAAWDLVKKDAKTDTDEFLEVFPLALKTAVEWVRQGKIMDSKSVIALLTIETFKLNPYLSLTNPEPRINFHA